MDSQDEGINARNGKGSERSARSLARRRGPFLWIAIASTLFLALPLAAPVLASPAGCAFEGLAHWVRDPAVYRCYACNTNVIYLLQKLRSVPGFDMKDARVIYVYSEDPKLPLIAMRTRDGYKRWGFHVALEYRGQILDLDTYGALKDLSPEIFFQNLKAKSSYRSQSAPNNFDLIRVREIPASTYIREYDTKAAGEATLDWKYFLSHPEAEKRFPAMTAKEFSSRMQARSPAESSGPAPQLQNVLKIEHDPVTRESVSITMDDQKSRYVYDVATGQIRVFRKGIEVTSPELSLLQDQFRKRLREEAATDPYLYRVIRNMAADPR